MEPNTNKNTALPSGYTEEPIEQAPTPNSLPAGYTEEPIGDSQTPPAKLPPQLQSYDEAKHGRYTTPQDYQKWATYPPGAGGTPNREWKPGEADAWTEAHNLSLKDAAKGAAMSTGAGLAAGTGVLGAAEVLPSILPHTVEGIKAIGAWAERNPVQAYMLYNVIKELVPGAKKAIGLVKGVPTE